MTVVLIGSFAGIYALIVRPKSLPAGLALGSFVGLAFGNLVGGWHVHSHADSACVAWGWFIAGWLKGVVAGGIVGAVIVEPNHGPDSRRGLTRARPAARALVTRFEA